MAAELPHYEILAVRYGTSSARPASQNFIMSDGHDIELWQHNRKVTRLEHEPK